MVNHTDAASRTTHGAPQGSLHRARTRFQRRWDRGERGAALVEAAIVFMPMSLLLFGIVEYGLIFKESLTISNATRSGARAASAEARSTSFYLSTVDAVTVGATGLTFKGGEELFIYRARADGLPQSGNIDVCSTNCRRYVYKLSSGKFERDGGSDWTVTSQNACIGTADSVGVRLKVQHNALTGFFHNLPLREKTIMRLEPMGEGCS